MAWDAFLPSLSSIAARCAGRLVSHHWAQLDECLSETWAEALAAECLLLEEAQLLSPHTFEFAAEGGRVQYQHPGRRFVDLEAPRVTPAVAARAPGLAHFAAVAAGSFTRRLQEAAPSLQLRPEVQVKLQLTCGSSGCAPCHYDTSETAPGRQVTWLLYLGDWKEEYGAELVLQPFLDSEVKISPLFNRGILFLSDRLLHYTLPPTREGATFGRWLLTIWLEGDSVDAPLGQRWPPLLQRTLAPAIYSKVFLSSLERSMPPGPALDALKAAQEEEITSLESDETFGEMLPDLREAALDAIASNRKRKSSGMGKEVLMKLELLEAQDLCLATLEGHERLEYAKGRKDAGGRYFKRGWFQAALERYSLTAEMLTHRDDIKDNSLWSQAQEVKSACELNAAACLLKLEKWRDVEAVCNAILRTNPANEKALFRRGKALLALGEADRAEKDLKKVLEVNAGNSEAKHLLQQARKESKGTKRERNVYAAMLQSE
ncbi:Peptidyl-prolyl cis-trans isomerase FKBP62 (PPIase FKBP62) (70 kDa peptidyl-prolyl isomerase) (FK506-binding protein 62) (AtFKBP62) (Immunophilin FKBP62) (Peptidylprolyl isomerase ROF1) (Protein ROTAMASE FKBP 1) (Rotamase) [Durusdinium trenchii]|uniref:Prolyl 4-hydroxylase alpha subunit domain-containing protein n=1 Tax=Durusdinium trenchii TaxID=1381693 RepID=A0ABP0QVM8_9DINO